jgi:hypothetical protein
MKDFLASLAPQVLDILGPMLIAALTYASVRLAAYIKAHTENVRAQGILLRLNDAVATGVGSVEQTVVSTLQANTVDGRLSPQAAGKAKDAAIALIKAQLGDKGLAELIAILGVAPAAVDGVISSKVEASVGKLPDSPPRPSNSGAVVPTGKMRDPDEDITKDIPPRDPTKGSVSLSGLLIVCAFSAFVGTFAMLKVSHAQTPTPVYGGCLSGGTVCFGPSASITVASFNLATSQFTGGVQPGVGYGVTYTPPSAPWAAVGADIDASLRLGQGQPNTATFSLMGHFANYIFLGVGPSITQEPVGVPALVQWSILGGLGVPIDLSAYKAQAAKAAAN